MVDDDNVLGDDDDDDDDDDGVVVAKLALHYYSHFMMSFCFHCHVGAYLFTIMRSSERLQSVDIAGFLLAFTHSRISLPIRFAGAASL